MRFIKNLKILLEEIEKEEENLNKAVLKTVEVIKNGGIIHILGFGHYNVIPLEFFFKPGLLACTNPILDLNTLYVNSIYKANFLEKIEGYGRYLVKNIDIRTNDLVYIISYSGRDLIAIDSCLEAKKKGAYVIGLINKENSLKPSKHPLKKNLKDLVDLAFFLPGPSDELILSLSEDENVKFGPIGNLIAIITLHQIFSQTIYELERLGIIPPIFRVPTNSQNEDLNEKLINIYKERIRFY